MGSAALSVALGTCASLAPTIAVTSDHRPERMPLLMSMSRGHFCILIVGQLRILQQLAKCEFGIQNIVSADKDSGLVKDSPVLPDCGKELASDAVGVRSLVHQKARLRPYG
jgi:hypothetical protein